MAVDEDLLAVMLRPEDVDYLLAHYTPYVRGSRTSHLRDGEAWTWARICAALKEARTTPWRTGAPWEV